MHLHFPEPDHLLPSPTNSAEGDAKNSRAGVARSLGRMCFADRSQVNPGGRPTNSAPMEARTMARLMILVVVALALAIAAGFAWYGGILARVPGAWD